MTIAGLGTGVGTAAFAVVALPELYIDWGSLAGVLVVIPALAATLGLLAGIVLAAFHRLRWMHVPLVVALGTLVAEGLYALSLETPLAAWNASRHWRAAQGQARAAVEETLVGVCRKLAGRRPTPPPPGPPGAAPVRASVPETAAPGSTLMISSDSCAAVLGRAPARD
ncbi:MAG: hypothetical protein HY560_14490 [Gemmatimonadetes bacterium]|nr:hypothetical protein [Gemmatimonadota bacterium]